MSELQTRLRKLGSSLTARQRFLALLRAHHAGEDPDPELRRTMPPEQEAEFNRYLRVVFVCDAMLGAALETLDGHVSDVEWFLGRVRVIEKAADQLEQEHPETMAQPGDRRPRGRATVGEFLRGMAKDMRKELAGDVTFRWGELLTIERLWRETAASLDGLDVVAPERRERAADIRTRLEQAADGAGKRAHLLREPTAEQAESLHRQVLAIYAHFGWTEPDPPKPATTGSKR